MTHHLLHLEQISSDKKDLVMNITNSNSIYIKGIFKYSGYKQIELHCYVDTGASMCVASKHVIPNEHWVNAERIITVKTANGPITINKVCKNLTVRLAGELFHIPSVYQQDSGVDFIIGNNFCLLYGPFAQFTDRIIFHLNDVPIVIGKIKAAYNKGQKGFLESMNFFSKTPQPQPINISTDKIQLLEGGE